MPTPKKTPSTKEPKTEVTSLRKSHRDQIESVVNKQLARYAFRFATILVLVVGGSLYSIAIAVHTKMEELVRKQFDEPNIQKVVKAAAIERSDNLMKSQIEPEVARFKAEVAGQLLTLNILVTNAQELAAASALYARNIRDVQNALLHDLSEIDSRLHAATLAQSNLQEVADFQFLVTRASCDDAVAWDKLNEYATNLCFRFADEAYSAACTIALPTAGNEIGCFRVIDDGTVNSLKRASFDALLEAILKSPGFLHAHALILVRDRKDLTRFEKLTLYVRVLESSDSMNGRSAAGKLLAKEAGLYFNTMRKAPWLEWWGQNKERIRAECERK